MKAAVFYGPFDVKTEDVETPAIKDGEILVKVEACGICGSDLHMYKLGLFTDIICRPSGNGGIPGHEYAGKVVEVGQKVQGIEIGDRVVAISNGGMAEYVTANGLSAFSVHKLPDGVSYEEGATLEPLSNSLHAALKGRPKAGENIVVYGAGIIGLGVIQCLKALDVELNKLIAVDFSDKRLEVAKKLGADEIINASIDDPFEKSMELLGEAKLTFVPELSTPAVDTVYDCVGYMKDREGISVLQQALNMVRDMTGRIVEVGVFEDSLTLDLMPFVIKQVDLIGSYAFSTSEAKRALELIQSGKIDRTKIISHQFPLEKAKEAFDMACKSDESVKVIIKPSLSD